MTLVQPTLVNPTISLFSDRDRGQQEKEVTLAELVEKIRTCPVLKAQTEALRAMTPEQYFAAKKAGLPAATPAGHFPNRRNKSAVWNPSHLVFTENDGDTAFVESPSLVLSYVTNSGKGRANWVLVDGASPKTYDSFYEAAVREMGGNASNDTSVRDYTHLAYLASDPQAYFNPDATPLEVKGRWAGTGSIGMQAVRRGENPQNAMLAYNQTLAKPYPTSEVIRYSEWFTKLLNSGELQLTQNNQLKPNVTNVFHCLQELGYDFRYNTFSGRVEWSDGTQIDQIKHLDPMTKELESRFYFSPSDNVLLKAINNLAVERPSDPVLDPLLALKWDGIERLHGLAETYGAKPTRYNHEVLALIWKGYVGVQLQPGKSFPYMPVLASFDQGVGKGRSLEVMVGSIGLLSSLPALNQAAWKKLAMEASEGRTLLQADELEGFSKAAMTTLKSYLTETHVSGIRGAFERHAKDRPKRHIVVGTTNDPRLHDRQNRRFPVVEVGESSHIDLAYLQKNRDQLLAEAVAEHDWTNHQIALPEDLWAEVEERAQLYRTPSVVETAVLEGVAQCLSEATEEVVIPKALVRQWVTDRGETGDHRWKVAKLMERSGFTDAKRTLNGRRENCWVRPKGGVCTT